MSTHADTQRLLDEITLFIEQSRTLMQQDAILEMGGLDAQVGVLCDAVLRLSQEDRVAYAAKLQELLLDLKALGEEMAARRDRIGDEIRGVPQFKKANNAYRKADASDGYHQRKQEDDNDEYNY